MKSIHSRKALVLGGLLLVTLAAGCAGGPEWSNNRYGYGSDGYGNAYPNLDGSAGSYPYNNSVYASSSPYDNGYGSYYPYSNGGYNQAYAYPVNHNNPDFRDGENYGRGDDNRDRHEEPNAERRANLGHDRAANSVKGSTRVYR